MKNISSKNIEKYKNRFVIKVCPVCFGGDLISREMDLA